VSAAKPMTREAFDAAADNPFVRIAHTILKQLPDAAFDGEPFMLTSLERADCVSCHCFYHSVVITPKLVAVFTNEAGGYRLDGPDGRTPGWFDRTLAETKALFGIADTPVVAGA
jgi:hypothetical protein